MTRNRERAAPSPSPDCQSAALTISERQSLLAEHFAQDAIPFPEVLDSVLLMTVEPASEGQHEETSLDWERFHDRDVLRRPGRKFGVPRSSGRLHHPGSAGLARYSDLRFRGRQDPGLLVGLERREVVPTVAEGLVLGLPAAA